MKPLLQLIDSMAAEERNIFYKFCVSVGTEFGTWSSRLIVAKARVIIMALYGLRSPYLMEAW